MPEVIRLARRPAPDTRERILDTAALLFYDHGVQAVGMQQIIDRAKCGKSLLYREFPSKAELVAEYLERARRDFGRQYAEADDHAGSDPSARLIAFVEAMAEGVQSPDYRGCPFRNYLAEVADHDDSAGRIATGYLLDTRARIENFVADMNVAAPDVLAERIWLIVEGLHTAAAHPGGGRAADVALSLVRELVRDAMRV
ncbi:TetR family transcriptional regulator [Planotetraspora silvatica]|uniref:TetR family transcriptional regulator n=1 Tax=Planotetraspora silvatica TaxID=234614 RepID=A0A8J3XRQ0_9ACTN|nr:TetR family transcriptional regulator [Planotetraspora silvatica]